MTGRLIAIVGPSGVGKDSVMIALQKQDARIVLARRVITRPSETGGEEFEGVTAAEFAKRARANDFALCWTAHDLQYGIPATVDVDLMAGRDVLANLSRSVLCQAQTRFDRLEVVALTADRAALSTRLIGRGRETSAQIAKRLDRAQTVIPHGLKTHVIDNSGALSQTVQTAMALLFPLRSTGCE